ncbi:hypothetical protein KI809_09920 [Geobacter pelophilus]|uniref:Secreted protein n=1 Tax=Geoanaerobacter pelophilus TaxID=60036 RepID=A0AAW4L9A7_9BACT|nr:hypothetical protein [Geoanaerobacter pelophilus]MBT0664614.1 hypothetical protein [Geoanaerobacter pelophilus]
MKKLLRIAFVVMALFVFFCGTSYGGADELMKLVENRSFWSTYKWGTLEESELYQLTKWSLRGMTKSGDYIFHKYITDENIPYFNTRMSIFVNSNNNQIISYDIYPDFNETTTPDDYNRLVNWCNEKYGNASGEKKYTRTNNGLTLNKTTSDWVLDNTTITVSIQNNLSQGKDSIGFITTLSFKKNESN